MAYGAEMDSRFFPKKRKEKKFPGGDILNLGRKYKNIVYPVFFLFSNIIRVNNKYIIF